MVERKIANINRDDIAGTFVQRELAKDTLFEPHEHETTGKTNEDGIGNTLIGRELQNDQLIEPNQKELSKHDNKDESFRDDIQDTIIAKELETEKDIPTQTDEPISKQPKLQQDVKSAVENPFQKAVKRTYVDAKNELNRIKQQRFMNTGNNQHSRIDSNYISYSKDNNWDDIGDTIIARELDEQYDKLYHESIGEKIGNVFDNAIDKIDKAAEKIIGFFSPPVEKQTSLPASSTLSSSIEQPNPTQTSDQNLLPPPPKHLTRKQ